MTSLLLAMALVAAPADIAPIARKLAGQILVGGRSFGYLRTLCDQIGARVTGGDAHRRAVAWAEAELRAAGLRVTRERFTITNGWERGSAEARLVAPVARPLHVLSVAWSPSTPPGGVQGEVVILRDVSLASLTARALRGRIVVLDTESLFSAPAAYEEVLARVEAAMPRLVWAGVQAVVWSGTRPNNVIKVSGLKYANARLGALPAADLGLEDFRLIERLAAAGPVRVELRLANRTSGAVEVENVIGELAGRTSPGDWVLLGAHLDSWDLGAGAQDDGTGVAMVLEAARALATVDRPRRSVRFALWAGEEQGTLGSLAYARAHASELGRLAAVLNLDDGAGAPRGWEVNGRDDLAAALEPLGPILQGLGGGGVSRAASCSSDHAVFAVGGLPALNLWVDTEHYPAIHHLGSDTVDKVSAAFLAAGSAIAAITAYALAERAEALPRLAPVAVDALLEKAGLRRCRKALESAVPR